MATCVCTRPTDGYLCRTCVRSLSDDLKKIAEWWPETLVTLARQHVMPSNSSNGKMKGGAKGDGLPFHYGAAMVRYEVESGITTWLRDVAGDRAPEGVSTVQQACEWMATYATMIGNLPQGPQVLDDVHRYRKELERLIDRRPDRIIVAHCDMCGKGLSDEPGALSAVCDDCDQVVVVVTQRSKRVEKAQQKIVTPDRAVSIVAIAYRYRITAKTIARWIERGEITKHEQGVMVADVLRETEKLIAKRRARVA